MSGPSALCRALALCVGARHFVSGPGLLVSGSGRGPAFLSQYCLCQVPCSLSGPGALFVGARQSVRPTISVSGPGALCCVGPRRRALARYPGSACHPAPSGQLRVPPTPAPRPIYLASRAATHPHLRASAQPGTTGPSSAGPQLPSACRLSCRAPSSDPRAIRLTGPSSDPRATHLARRVPFGQERTPNLTVWGLIKYICIYIYMMVADGIGQTSQLPRHEL